MADIDWDALVAFLRARLDEDEQDARDATGGSWEVGPSFGARNSRVYVRPEGDLLDTIGTCEGDRINDCGTCVIACQVSNVPQWRGNARHIARHDPARVLADVAAHRAVLDMYHAMSVGADAAKGTILAGAAKVRLGAYGNVLRALASCIYAGHPDFQPGWEIETEVGPRPSPPRR